MFDNALPPHNTLSGLALMDAERDASQVARVTRQRFHTLSKPSWTPGTSRPRDPDATKPWYEGQHFTYHDLNEASNWLGRHWPIEQG